MVLLKGRQVRLVLAPDDGPEAHRTDGVEGGVGIAAVGKRLGLGGGHDAPFWADDASHGLKDLFRI
jgi:hypothetical protein